jgi:tripartite tricarboxylate transporter TctB family protein
VLERICAAILAVLSAVLLVMSLRYGLFNGSQPGPGLFPAIVTALLLVLSILWLITGPGRSAERDSQLDSPTAETDTTEKSPKGRVGAGVVVFTVLWSLVPILLLDRIGFFLTMIPYVAVMLIVIARLRWWLVLLLTVVSTFAVTIGADAIGLSLPDPYRIFSHIGF